MKFYDELKDFAGIKKLTREMTDNSLVNLGNYSRIAKTMRKAENGESVCIAFFGGSITAGSAASSSESCFANLVYKWWKEKFPKSDIKFVNAGIGATNSNIGVHRLKKHVLDFEPDFVLAEFSVNDKDDCENRIGGTYSPLDSTAGDCYSASYEAVLRRLLSNDNKMGVAVLFLTAKSTNGPKDSAEKIQCEIANHYNLPSVSCSKGFWNQIESGEMAVEEIWSNDNLHPNDSGHAVIATLIVNMLEKIYADINNDTEYVLPEPFNAKSLEFMNGEIYFENDLTPDSMGSWYRAKGLHCKFVTGFKTEGGGEPLVLTFENVSSLRLLAKMDVAPSGKIKIDVNGVITYIDANFTGGWGAYMWQYPVFENKTPVTVKVTITEIFNKPFAIGAILKA
ncbi:MAG: hypothetical protein E7568_04855 [Ruminococcaceae bacterium]|nr:hypothetical protein [Oscillospiraceae bacterium]